MCEKNHVIGNPASHKTVRIRPLVNFVKASKFSQMPAPAGNQFWKARSSHGRSPIIIDPEKLWTACCEYFEWVDAHPLYEAKPFAYQGEVKIENVAKMRAMTISPARSRKSSAPRSSNRNSPAKTANRCRWSPWSMSQSAVLDLELHPKQGIAYNTEATETLYGGAAGGGGSSSWRRLLGRPRSFDTSPPAPSWS